MIASGNYSKVIPKQTSLEFEFVSNDPALFSSETFVGFSGNSSLIGFNFKSGALEDISGNLIGSFDGSNTNIKLFKDENNLITYVNDEIVSCLLITGEFQNFISNSTVKVDASLSLLAKLPQLRIEKINNFSGVSGNTITGFIVNDNSSTNFKINNLSVTNSSLIQVSSFDTGVINQSGQFVLEFINTNIPYQGDDMYISAETNAGNYNFIISHSPYNDYEKVNEILVIPSTGITIE
jgi:hypothetical protein